MGNIRTRIIGVSLPEDSENLGQIDIGDTVNLERTIEALTRDLGVMKDVNVTSGLAEVRVGFCRSRVEGKPVSCLLEVSLADSTWVSRDIGTSPSHALERTSEKIRSLAASHDPWEERVGPSSAA